MAQLIVRNLDEEIVARLKRRAAQHGRSAEAEHREILREALLPKKAKECIKTLLRQMPDVGEDGDFERMDDRGRKVDL